MTKIKYLIIALTVLNISSHSFAADEGISGDLKWLQFIPYDVLVTKYYKRGVDSPPELAAEYERRSALREYKGTVEKKEIIDKQASEVTEVYNELKESLEKEAILREEERAAEAKKIAKTFSEDGDLEATREAIKESVAKLTLTDAEEEFLRKSVKIGEQIRDEFGLPNTTAFISTSKLGAVGTYHTDSEDELFERAKEKVLEQIARRDMSIRIKAFIDQGMGTRAAENHAHSHYADPGTGFPEDQMLREPTMGYLRHASEARGAVIQKY